MSSREKALQLTTANNEDFQCVFQLFDDDEETPLDLTGMTFRAQLKKEQAVDAEVEAIFTTDTGTPTDGELTLSLPAADIAQLEPGAYWYDVLKTENGKTDNVWISQFFVVPGVTGPEGV